MDSTINDIEKKMCVESSFLSMYSSLEDAKIEIHRRWNDAVLREKVEKFLGNQTGIEKLFLGGPKAVYSRDIISPNHEFFCFMNLVEEHSMKPCFFEYGCGKLVAKNFSKYRLCKMAFHDTLCGDNKYDHSNKIVSLVDFNTQEGVRMDGVITKNGRRLVDVHHELLLGNCRSVEMKDITDISEWFNTHRHFSPWYYVLYLGMFICHGVLFDNFLLGKGEGDLMREKMLPSFEAIEDLFGVKPLIVSLTPFANEENDFWWYYPTEIKSQIRLN